jgi:hypothetical protein
MQFQSEKAGRLSLRQEHISPETSASGGNTNMPPSSDPMQLNLDIPFEDLDPSLFMTYANSINFERDFGHWFTDDVRIRNHAGEFPN